MGLGGISIWQLLIVLVIVLLLFGTKKLRNLGGDLGTAIKSFKKSVSDSEKKGEEETEEKEEAVTGNLEDASGSTVTAAESAEKEKS